MPIPDCYDPVFQAERRERDRDEFYARIPVCALCLKPMFPGMKFHTASYRIVCSECKEELDDNVDIVEEY